MDKRTSRARDGRLFSIRQASAETGIPAVTLRAWEARHRLVTPARGAGRYRVYTAAEIDLLRWVKRRVDSGVPIRLAAAEAKLLPAAGSASGSAARPAVHPPAEGETAAFAEKLFRALLARNERAAEECLDSAGAGLGVDSLCLGVMAPCLWRIGDAWERGEIRVAGEHFASNLLRGYLLGLFQSLPAGRRGPLILIGCAPGELHDIGSLMLALLLRERGRRVEFLGQDLNLEDLRAYVGETHPALVCLSANAEPAARALAEFESSLVRIRPRPRFGFGGRGFAGKPALQKAVPGIFLGDALPDALARIEILLKK